MINAITTKIEIDAMQPADIDPAMQLAIAHAMPAIVVHPQLVNQAIAIRIRRRGQFKIIVPVDFPKGEVYGVLKVRGMTPEQMAVDGYEFILTGDRTESETRNEAKALTEFVRTHISPISEIRFVLGTLMHTPSNIEKMAKGMKDVPTPVLLRTDHHLKTQVTKANVEAHSTSIKLIQKHTSIPLKVSGNIDSVRTLAGCMEAGASRFAVSLQQAQTIDQELRQQPAGLKELLSK